MPKNLAQEPSDCNHIPSFFLILPHSSSFFFILAFSALLHGSGSLWMWSGKVANGYCWNHMGSHLTHGQEASPTRCAQIWVQNRRSSAKLKVFDCGGGEVWPNCATRLATRCHTMPQRPRPLRIFRSVQCTWHHRSKWKAFAVALLSLHRVYM